MTVALHEEPFLSQAMEADAKVGAPPWPGVPNVYERSLLDLFRDLPRGRLLDAPCGPGRMLVWLKEMGYEVHGFDIDAESFQAAGTPFNTGDLNLGMPHADHSFDLILCKNGAQRISALDCLMSEFRRVLQPGGILVVSLPNYARIQRRLRYFAFGSVSTNVNSQVCAGSVDSPTANFRACLLYPQLEKTLNRNGFQVDRILSDGKPYAAFHLLPFVGVAKLLSICASNHKQQGYSLRGANSAHALAGGRHLILVAKRME